MMRIRTVKIFPTRVMATIPLGNQRLEQSGSDAELLETARDRGTTTFHMIGTCKMGPAADPSAVVGPDLRVHGMPNLRVVDASIMPTMPAANTNAASLLIGEKGADLILSGA